MQSFISFILVVFVLPSFSLTGANKLQSNTSTSKCKVDMKFTFKNKLLVFTDKRHKTNRFDFVSSNFCATSYFMPDVFRSHEYFVWVPIEIQL